MGLTGLLFVGVVFSVALLIALRKLEHGLYLMVFTAPFMEVFKAEAFGINIRANEVIPLAVFLAVALSALMGRRVRRPPAWLVLLTGLLLLAIVVSLTANAGSGAVKVESTSGEFSFQNPRTVGIKTLIHATGCILACLTAARLSSNPRALEGAVKVMMVSTALVCLWSLMNLAGYWSGIHYLGITPQNIWGGRSGARIRGTLSEPSYFANYLALILPPVFFCRVARRRVLSHSLDRLILGLIALTILLTFSAGGWFILAIFAVGLPLMAWWSGYRVQQGAAAVIGLTVLGAIIVAGINEFVDPRYSRMFQSGVLGKLFNPTGQTSGGVRLAKTVIGLEFFADHPLVGIGPNMLRFRWVERASSDMIEAGRLAIGGGGSMWAFHAAELGLLGILPIVCIFGKAIGSTARAARRCADRTVRPILVGFATGLLTCCIHYMAHETLWWPYVWIYLGLSAGAVQVQEQRSRVPAAAPAPAGYGIETRPYPASDRTLGKLPALARRDAEPLLRSGWSGPR